MVMKCLMTIDVIKGRTLPVGSSRAFMQASFMITYVHTYVSV